LFSAGLLVGVAAIYYVYNRIYIDIYIYIYIFITHSSVFHPLTTSIACAINEVVDL
jgi:hypothetical protein